MSVKSLMKSLLHFLYVQSESQSAVGRLIGSASYIAGGNHRRLRGEGNSVRCAGAHLRGVTIDVIGQDNHIVLDRGSRLQNIRIHVRGSGHQLTVGENCNLRNGSLWLEDRDCQLTIGRSTSLDGGHIALTEPGSIITLGEDCMLAYDVDIRCGDSHSIIDLATNKRINYAGNVHIGNHVWLAAHVQILKGVSIGDNSVIGTRSVVTGAIPPNSVAAGTPARVLRSNVSWLRPRVYEDDRS